MFALHHAFVTCGIVCGYGAAVHAQCLPSVHAGAPYVGLRYDACTSPGKVVLAGAVWDADGDGPLAPGLVVALSGGVRAAGLPLGDLAFWDGGRWNSLFNHPTLGPAPDGRTDLAVHNGRLVVLSPGLYNTGLPTMIRLAAFDGTDWSVFGAEPSQWTQARRVVSTSEGLFVIGDFLRLGASYGHVARWDGSAWSHVGNGYWSTGANSPAAVASHGGWTYIGGWRAAEDATPRATLTRHGQQGSEVVGGGLNGEVGHLAALDDVLYVAGGFTEAGGVATPGGIAAWDGAVWNDAAFPDPGSQILQMERVAGRLVVVARSNDRLSTFEYDGAEWMRTFEGSYGGAPTRVVEYEGVPVLLGAGYMGERFVAHASAYREGAWVGLNPGTDTQIARLLSDDDGLVAVGAMRQLEGVPVDCIARLTADGWEAFPPLTGDSGELHDATLWDGELVAAGSHVPQDRPELAYVVRWDGAAWQAIGAGYGAGPARCVTATRDGLFVGARDGVAQFDGEMWSIIGEVASASDMPVRSLTMHDGELVAGGVFTAIGGVSARNVARWDGTHWQPLGAGLDGSVWSLVNWQGRLLAGGSFVLPGWGGTGVVEWNGSQWTPFEGGTDGAVYALNVIDEGLLVSGAFTHAGGVGAEHAAIFDGERWRDSGLAPGDCGTIRTAINDGDGLAIGGDFGRIAESGAAFFARVTLPCPADYTCDGQVDVMDLLAFLSDFSACDQQSAPCGEAGDADVNGDGIVDVLDFLEFLDLMDEPCS